MKNFLRFLSYVLVAAVASCVTLVYFQSAGTDSGIAKLSQLEKLIEQRFIGEEDPQLMYDAAAAAMVDSLGDRWSHYLSAADYAAYVEQAKNAYVGIGITVVAREDGCLDVTKVEANGPAQEAGIAVGDVLVAVSGQSIAEIGMGAAKELIRGKAGTRVELELLRAEETLTLTVTRREIQTVVASGKMLTDTVGLVRIENFDSRCASETIAAIELLLEQGAQSLVFDVRYNPGGYKDELVDVLNYLLPAGPLFRSENYKGDTYVDTSDDKCLQIPMAVLVNASSYSAAEFFAAALREYDAAVVVGQATVGKGRFQNTFALRDGSGVMLSTGKYATPNGVTLEGVGITPDVPVEVDDQTAAKIYAGTLDSLEDPQIQAALEALKAA